MSLPVSPMTQSINGAETVVVGTIQSASRDWIVLQGAGPDQIWVPKSAILLITVP